MDRIGAAFQIKTVDFGQRIISGWAAYHSNVDRVADIIEPAASQKAVARLSDPSEVGVFVGHDMSRLPVGVPVKIEARSEGLYTETRIFEGPAGDDLLGAARGLMAAGRSLGQSIGYRVRDSRPDRVAGKSIRRLLDYSLHEYSFAASQAIANDKALVTGVKAGGGQMKYTVEKSGDKYHVMKNGASLASYDTEETASARSDALNSDDGKTINDLPDSAFLMVEAGGQLDEGGRTVPRSKRHFAYRDHAGALDAAALRSAVEAIPQAKTLGLADADLGRLQARARALLESAGALSMKTVDADAAEWREGVPIAVRGLGYQLLDLSEQMAQEHKAMVLLGDDTKAGQRMRPEMRVKVRELAQQLTEIVAWAETVDRGEDGAARVASLRQQLELLGV